MSKNAPCQWVMTDGVGWLPGNKCGREVRQGAQWCPVHIGVQAKRDKKAIKPK